MRSIPKRPSASGADLGRPTSSRTPLYGQAREGASQIAGAAKETTAAARESASSFEGSLRNTIETQPYTAVLLALGLGWLLGRMHRPM
jgi:hypothetical protein